MTYLAVGEQYRSLLMVSIMSMVVGLILLVFSLSLASQGITVLSLCMVTPIIVSMTNS